MMMKIVIPYSGSGTNSAYGLWRFLNETDHEVFALHLNVAWRPDDEREHERAQFDQGVAWLKSNCRDFSVTYKNCSNRFDFPDMPLRPGFANKIGISQLSSVWQTALEHAVEVGAEAVAIGTSGESTATDRAIHMQRETFWNSERNPTNVKIYYPCWSMSEEVTEDLWPRICNEITGRWLQRELMPEPLRNIVMTCRCKGEKVRCLRCSDFLTHELCEDSGSDLDERMLRALHAGKHRDLADPAAEKYWNNFMWALAEELGYDVPSCFADDNFNSEISAKAKALFERVTA